MGRPREHDAVTKDALLEAAERLVADGGADALTVRAVADAVGTTTRAVYSLFASKAGLVEALGIRLFAELSAAVDDVELTADPVGDLTTASLRGFRRMATDHPALYRLVFLRAEADGELGADFDAAATAAFARLEALVARIEAVLGLGGRSVTEVAQAVHALTEGLATAELRRGEQPGAERQWADAIRALVLGFVATPSPEGRAGVPADRRRSAKSVSPGRPRR